MSNTVKGTITNVGKALPKVLEDTAKDPFKLALALGTGGGTALTDVAGEAVDPSNEMPDQTPPVPVLPTIDNEDVRKATKRRAALLRSRGGRQSTILTGGSSTGGSDTLGG